MAGSTRQFDLNTATTAKAERPNARARNIAKPTQGKSISSLACGGCFLEGEMEMSVKQTRKGVWYYRFNLNRCRFRVQGFKTRTDAEKAEAIKKAEALRLQALGQDLNNNKLTLAEAADMFFTEYVVPQRKSVTGYRGMIRHMIGYFGDKRIIDIKPRDVEAFRAWLLKNRKGIKQAKVSLHTVNHYHAAMKAIINWAKKKRLYFGDNPAWGIEMFKVEKARVRYLHPEEESRLTPVVARHSRLWPYYVIALHTGMRLGEIAAICVKDVIRFPQAMIFIPKSKSSRSRYVPLHGLAIEVVRARLQQKNPEAVLLDHIHKTTVSLWFNEACREAQVPEFSFHCLRHTFAAHLLTRGVPIYKVSKMLGHSTARVTEEHYGHLDKTELAKEIHHIDGVLNVPQVAQLTASTVENHEVANSGANSQ